jgi:site-specific recombinase XerD
MEVIMKTIKELIDGVSEALRENRYTDLTMAGYEPRWRIFSRYAEEKNVSVFTNEFGLSFLKEKCGYIPGVPLKTTQRAYVRTISMLDEYDKYGIISSKRLTRKIFIFQEDFADTVQLYITERKAEGLSDSRIKSYKIYIERFTLYLHNESVRGFSELCGCHVDAFINSLSIYSASTVVNTLCCMRCFLIYLHKKGITAKDLSFFVPAIRYDKENTIPSAFTRDEVEKVLSCVDRANPEGKRNYAMLLLAARLGLRSSDICGMMLDSLNWDENVIEINKQQKTSKPIQIPLLNEVGDAIIEYLRCRPQTDAKAVFIRLIPPFDRLESHSLYTITNKYLRRAQIRIPSGKRHGTHALRHSLGSIMLESHVPLPIISEIFTHSSSETTKIYLKINIGQLRECALDVPACEEIPQEVSE